MHTAAFGPHVQSPPPHFCNYKSCKEFLTMRYITAIVFIAFLTVVNSASAIVLELNATNGTPPGTYRIIAADPVQMNWANATGKLYVKIDQHTYPVTGTAGIGGYVGLFLLDAAQVRNCKRAGGGPATTSPRVFVGGNGSGYVYIRTLKFGTLGKYHALRIETPDGDIRCDNPLVPDPTDTIFKDGF